MSCIAYLVTQEGEHALCVIAGGAFHRFTVNLPTLARLNLETSERLLKAVPGAYATRLDGAAPLQGEAAA